VVVLLTEWDEFKNADPELLGELVRRRQIVDARHALDLRRWQQADWTIRALGRPVDKIPARESRQPDRLPLMPQGLPARYRQRCQGRSRKAAHASR
jgi:hypothetical protein